MISYNIYYLRLKRWVNVPQKLIIETKILTIQMPNNIQCWIIIKYPLRIVLKLDPITIAEFLLTDKAMMRMKNMNIVIVRL